MTEKEAIETPQELSLERCEAFGFDCGNCDKCKVTTAYSMVIKALGLIKQQQAEIKKLEKARQKQGVLLCGLRKQKYELMNRMSIVKCEAYKEFADRVKQVIILNNTHDGYLAHDIDYSCLMEDIDDVLKELVSENK